MLIQIIDKLFFHSIDIYPFSLQIMVTFIMILVGLGCGYFLVKKIFQTDSKINARTLIILILLTLAFFVLNVGFNSFRSADEEWATIDRARTMAEGNKTIYSQENSGIVFPIIVANLLKISHFDYPIIRIFNIALGTLSLWLIFGCARTIFEDDSVGILSVIVYILTPWTYRYTGVLFGLPTLVHFLSLLSLFTILLAFKYHYISLHLLALGSLLVLNQTKMEYFLYYYIYLVIFCLFREYKKLKRKEIILFSIVAIMLLIPPVIKANMFKISFLRNPGWCGFQAQSLSSTGANNAIIIGADVILHRIINNRISLSYFLDDLPVFLKFWGQTNLILPIILSIIGITLSFKEYPKKKMQILLPLLFFGFLATGYLFDCGWYEARHAISAYGFLVIFAGYCLYWLFQTSKAWRVGRILMTGVIVYLLTFQAIICFNYLSDYRTEINMFKSRFNAYSVNTQLLRGFSRRQALFITADNTNRDILHCLGYRAISFSDSLGSNSGVLDVETSVNSFLNSAIITNESEVYFLKSFACNDLDIFKKFCETLASRSLKIEREIYIPSEDFKTQLFIIKNVQ